jgi:hypothetical protein
LKGRHDIDASKKFKTRESRHEFRRESVVGLLRECIGL